MADTAGLVSYANRRWQDMGYLQSQVLGAPLEKLVSSSRREAFREAFHAIQPAIRWTISTCKSCVGTGAWGSFPSI